MNAPQRALELDPGPQPLAEYRITEGDTSLCYIPDHGPALGVDLKELEPEWISGFELARDASLLIHDCQ